MCFTVLLPGAINFQKRSAPRREAHSQPAHPTGTPGVLPQGRSPPSRSTARSLSPSPTAPQRGRPGAQRRGSAGSSRAARGAVRGSGPNRHTVTLPRARAPSARPRSLRSPPGPPPAPNSRRGLASGPGGSHRRYCAHSRLILRRSPPACRSAAALTGRPGPPPPRRRRYRCCRRLRPPPPSSRAGPAAAAGRGRKGGAARPRSAFRPPAGRPGSLRLCPQAAARPCPTRSAVLRPSPPRASRRAGRASGPGPAATSGGATGKAFPRAFPPPTRSGGRRLVLPLLWQPRGAAGRRHDNRGAFPPAHPAGLSAPPAPRPTQRPHPGVPARRPGAPRSPGKASLLGERPARAPSLHEQARAAPTPPDGTGLGGKPCTTAPGHLGTALRHIQI